MSINTDDTFGRITQGIENINLNGIVSHGALFLSSLFYLLPLLWMFSVSLRPVEEVYQNPIALVFTVRPENYLQVWQQTNFGQVLLNSLSVTLGTTLLIVAFSTLAAYSIAWMTFRGQDSLLVLLMSGIFLPTVAIIVPVFKISARLGIWNSVWGLIPIYTAIFSPIALLTIVGFFDDMPDSLRDAAMLDGCNNLQFLWNICLPMSKPVLKAAGILVAVFAWNEFTIALVMLQNESLMTIPLKLNLYNSVYNYDLVAQFVLLSLSVLPILIAYVFLWRELETGVTTGGV